MFSSIPHSLYSPLLSLSYSFWTPKTRTTICPSCRFWRRGERKKKKRDWTLCSPRWFCVCMYIYIYINEFSYCESVESVYHVLSLCVFGNRVLNLLYVSLFAGKDYRAELISTYINYFHIYSIAYRVVNSKTLLIYIYIYIYSQTYIYIYIYVSLNCSV